MWPTELDRSTPAVDDVPGAAGVGRLEQPAPLAAAAREQDEADAAAERVAGRTEVDLRLCDVGAAGPARAAVARDIQRAASLPDDAEAVGGHRQPQRIAVGRDAAVCVPPRAERRVCDASPAARP